MKLGAELQPCHALQPWLSLGSRFQSYIHVTRHETVGVTLPCDIANARKSEVVADERKLILHRHVEYPLARLGGHHGIGIKIKCPVGMLKGNRGVRYEVPSENEVLASRRQEVRRMSRRGPGVEITRTPLTASLPSSMKTRRSLLGSRFLRAESTRSFITPVEEVFASSVQKSCSTWDIIICALGKRRLPSSLMIPER